MNIERKMNLDRVTSIFWLCISVVVAVASFRLGLGKLSAPGSGFTPFGASILLGILSIICFFQAKEKQEPENVEPLFSGQLWYKVILVFVVLFLYAQIMPFVGFTIATFLLMAFLFWIAGEKKIWKVVVFSLIAAVLSYMIFSKWLNLQFPNGPLGF
jgi:putative tricarboxylic transport membrane protein